MKVNFIIPPDPFLGDDKRNSPLGLLYVAAATRNAGHEVEVTDLRGIPTDKFREKDFTGYDAYGLTSSTPSYPFARGIAEEIKLKQPNAPIFIGGIHATVLQDRIDPEFCKIVSGEGERSVIELLNDIRSGNYEKRVYTSNPISNLDEIPFPARDLVPFDSAFSKNAFQVKGEYAGTIITSRGCPSNCSFCGSRAMWGKRVRFRSVDNVIQELEHIIDNYKVRCFRFQDDTVTLKKGRLKYLCEKMVPLGIRWRATTRVDCADSERLEWMKEAGCEEVGYGVESLDQEVLDRNSKGIKLNQIYEALQRTKDAGLKSRVFFIIGLPGEKEGFSDRLGEFLDKANPEGVDVSTFVPYPGSPIYSNPESFGISLKNNDFGRYHMTLGLREGEIDRSLTFRHDVLSEEQIIGERKKSLELIIKRQIVQNF